MSPAPPPANTTQQAVPIIRDNNFAKEDSGRDAATVSIVPATSNAQPHTSGQWSPFLSLRLLLFRNVRVEERSEVTAEAFGLNWPRPALVYLLACLVRRAWVVLPWSWVMRRAHLAMDGLPCTAPQGTGIMAAAIGLLVYGSQDDELTILWTVGGVLAAGCAYVSVCFAVSLSFDPKRGCRYVAVPSSVLWHGWMPWPVRLLTFVGVVDVIL